MITVDEIMSTDIVSANADSSLGELVKLMEQHSVRHLPVLEHGHLVGLVSQRDILAAGGSNIGSYIPAERELVERTIRARDIMTEQLKTIDVRANMRKAALLLQQHKYGCLPVVDGGSLVGIITDFDFVGVAINLLEQIEIAAPLDDGDSGDFEAA